MFINATKPMFLVPFERLLGHILFEQKITTDLNKIAIIVFLPLPTIVTKVKGSLWRTTYYKRFIFQHAVTVMPLIELLKKTDEALVWTSPCTHVFTTLSGS